MTSNTITVRLVTDPGMLPPLRTRWNELAEGGITRTSELTYEWQATFWKYFSAGDEDLFVLVAEEAGRVTGIAPLKLRVVRVNGVLLRCLVFLAASESNYQDIVTDDRSGRVHAAMWRFLRDHRGEWDRLDLENIPSASTTIGTFSPEGTGNALHFVRKRTRCLYLTIDRPWGEYYENRSRAHRDHMRKRMRKLGEAGPVRLWRVQEEPDLRKALDTLFEFHRARWNTTPTPSQFNDERMRSFYRECLDSLGRLDLMGLYVLMAGDVPAAAALVFTMGGTCITQIGSYNPRFEKLGPSVLLKRLFLEELFQQGYRAVDFGTYYDYKRSWADEETEKVSFEIYAGRTLRHRWCHGTTAVLAGARESLKRIPLLRTVIRGVRLMVWRRQPPSSVAEAERSE
jgi:CelD/BcsL family acetyltransferase involved in cellulose biosynthesis